MKNNNLKAAKLLLIGLMAFSYQTLSGQSKCDEGGKFFNDKRYRDAIEAYTACDILSLTNVLNFAKAVAENNFSSSNEKEQQEVIKRLNRLDKTPEVYYYLGLYYKEGKGVKQNSDSAIVNFEKAVTNVFRANLELAYLYEKSGKERKASLYFKKIADSEGMDIDDNEKARAMFYLGNFEKNDQDSRIELESKIKTALDWYEKAKELSSGELRRTLDNSINALLDTKIKKEVKLYNKNQKNRPIANTEVLIDGKIEAKTNENGNCSFWISFRETRDKPIMEFDISGYEKRMVDINDPNKWYLTPNKWLTSTENEIYERLNLKLGWGANKINFSTDNRDIESGWGNRFNAELNVNYFMSDKHPMFLGIGLRTNSYPFSKVDKYYYENLSYNTAYIPIGWKWQMVRFLYLNFQANFAYNFGAAYNNYLLDYELKDNKMITPFQIEFLSGLTLMKKGWGGIELNYGIAGFPVLNEEFKQTINDIEFKPFEGVSSISHGLILNVIIFIPGIK